MKKLFKSLMVLVLLVAPMFFLGTSSFAQEDTLLDYSSDWMDDYSTDSDIYTTTSFDIDEEAAGGILATVLGFGALFMVFAVVVSLATYIYTSLAFSKIGEKLGYENKWFAWVPVLNIVMIFQMGDQNPMLILLCLIPGIGALAVGIISIIAMMNISEKRGYDKMLGLLILVPLGNLVLPGLLAWKDPK